MERTTEELLTFATAYGLKVLGAILTLVVGRFSAGFVRRALRRAMIRSNVDLTIVKFAGNLAYVLILAFAIIGALAKFGVQTASFVAILGAASFAVGLALQGSLSNFASGVMLLLFRPFGVGDSIKAAGVAGTVKEINLFSTVVVTPDNVKILVPNGKLYGDIIQNFSAYDTRRLDLEVGIGYDSSIQKAQSVLSNLVHADQRVLTDPAPLIAVSELADSSVNLVLRVWVKRTDYGAVKFDFNRSIKESFDENEIEIPFPQRVVHTKAVQG